MLAQAARLRPAHDAAIRADERKTVTTALGILADPIPGAALEAAK